MSTKSSVVYYEYKKSFHIHIYEEMLSGKYYIEDENGRVELSEDVAKAFGKILLDKEKDSV